MNPISLEELPKVFSGMSADFNAADYSETINSFLPTLEDQHQRGFDESKDPNGARWPEWQWRALDADDNHYTLWVSGRLRQSLEKGHAEHIESVESRGFTWGTSVPYAGTHQNGASIVLGVPLVRRGGYARLKPGQVLNVPARPFVGFSEDSLGQLTDTIGEHAADSLIGMN